MDTSELTSAQVPCASLSPILFSCPHQRPSAIVSDLVSFRGSEDDPLDDSMSLVASDMEDWAGLKNDPTPLPIKARAGMDATLLHVLSKAVEELGLE